jgi:hypothetical protein
MRRVNVSYNRYKIGAISWGKRGELVGEILNWFLSEVEHRIREKMV